MNLMGRISLAALLWVPAVAAPDGWRIETDRAVAVRGKFAHHKDVSAAAMLGNGRMLVGSDETRGVQLARFDASGGRIDVEGLVTVLDGEGTELDLEGMAYSKTARTCYLVGSHALSRKKQELEADRSLVLSVPINESGLPQRSAIRKASLRPALQADSALAPFLDKPASANGLDIEALGERDGRLFFGLRAPSVEGKVTVLVAEAERLFSGAAPSFEKIMVSLGRERGFRDLVAIEGGFLLIAGSSGNDDDTAAAPGAFTLHFWDGRSDEAPSIGTIPAPNGKAEALTVIEETPAHILLLVFYDGAKDGGPRELRVLKPAAS
jgi:hypothetical protein